MKIDVTEGMLEEIRRAREDNASQQATSESEHIHNLGAWYCKGLSCSTCGKQHWENETEFLNAQLDRLAKLEREHGERALPCVWKHDSYHDMWETDCGNSHQFIADGPTDNHHHFCPYCGHPLQVAAADAAREASGE